jgi:predicted regulator of amino acid metabolism with ACT domain
MTKWTSLNTEKVCDKHACKADTKFAIKAFQKENPFVILFIIFIFTCVCFGWSLRSFELLYWETRNNPTQDWKYPMNAFWCIFVSMTTVGYGDFFAKTHAGRFITIMACLIGLYFTSMLMVFMTQKSALDENEKRAYNLISRLKLRYEIKEQRAYMIFTYLKMIAFKFQKQDGKISEKIFFINYGYERRNIFTKIEIIKNKHKLIDTFAQISLKEKIFNITDRITNDIKEINEETESIKFISKIIISFCDCQIDMVKNIKKNCYSIRLLYDILQKNKNKSIFRKLHNVDPIVKEYFEPQIIQEPESEEDEQINDFNYENYEDNIFEYYSDIEKITEHYKELHKKNKGQKLNKARAIKTLEFIKKRKSTNPAKLKKIQIRLIKSINSQQTVKKVKTMKTMLKIKTKKFKD